MNINKKVGFWLGLIFIISIGVFYFCKKTHPTMSEMSIAIITGSFISIVIAMINYWHEKEEFFNNLFYRGAFIYSDLEQIQQLILNLNETSNLKYTINTLIGYSSSLDNSISNVNFANYSPFNLCSKEYKTADYVQSLHTIFQQYIIFPINIIQRLNHELHMKKLTNASNDEIENLQQDIKKEISVLQINTKNLQDDYLKQMNYLHKKTKNRTRWEEGIKAINEFTPNNIKEYVKISINQPK
jgi:hypothetical protein